MKRNAQKLLALVIGLALVMSMFAMAEDGAQEVIDLGGEIVIDDGSGTDDGTGTAGGTGTARDGAVDRAREGVESAMTSSGVSPLCMRSRMVLRPPRSFSMSTAVTFPSSYVRAEVPVALMLASSARYTVARLPLT